MRHCRLVLQSNPTALNKLLRFLWQIIWLLLYRPSPIHAHAWRGLLLRLFGARIENGAHPYPTVKIWAPWNLVMRRDSCLGHYVDCYNVALVNIGVGCTVSQYSYLCTASHDYTRADMALLTAPITLGERVWITADVFVGPGVTIGDGTVVTARSSVFSDLPSWTVARGNPAEPFRKRELKEFDHETR